jgi:DNA-binding IclR family transcriptional regulator
MSKNPSIQVIDRAAALLNAIADYPEAVSLKLLAADTGLHPSTAHRILAALAEAALVERDGVGRYLLGRQLLHLAARVKRGIDIRQEAMDIMEGLRDQIGETVNLTVREGDEVIYVERVISKRMMRVEQVIGSRAPLHVTAVGKLMLAELGETFIRAFAQRTSLPVYTRHTIASLPALMDAAHLAGEAGFAFDNEEAEEGVGCIGVLVRDNSGQMAAGLSISAPIERRRDEWVPLLQEAGRKLSERLGYGGSERGGMLFPTGI